MGAADEILADLPLDQVAAELGTDEATAEQAIRDAVPSLIGSMQANAQDETGELSLAQALNQHSESPLYGGPFDVGQIDTNDGWAILEHVYGGQPQQLTTLADRQDQGLLRKLLPILAPIVLAYLAKKLNSGMAAPKDPQSPANPDTPMGGLGDILGQILGGAGAGTGGLSDILDQILGGGQRQAPAETPQQIPQQQQPQQQPSGPFNAPGQQADDPLRIPIDERVQEDEPQAQQQQPSGGDLGSILDQIFGRRS